MKVLPPDSSGCLLGYIKKENDPAYAEIPDTPETLIYVHIGKCGGESVWQAIQGNSAIKNAFTGIYRIHICKPPILDNARYLFVLRDPIQRALSAFNWRYKLVTENKLIVADHRTIRAQRDRFSGEHDVLTTYGSLDALGEALYGNDGRLNEDASNAFPKVHHLRENIAFYLSKLVDELDPQQIFSVMVAERLNADIARDFNGATLERFHANEASTPPDQLVLSNRARSNLRRFLNADYEAIATLLELSRRAGKRLDLPFDLGVPGASDHSP